MDENANKVHFKFTSFNFSMGVTVYAESCVRRIFKILSIQRHSYFFGKIRVALKSRLFVVAFDGYVNCACVLCFVANFISFPAVQKF